MKNIQKEEFDISKALLPYCKKNLPNSSQQPRQIDFLTLQNDLETFHEYQKKVCEEIVDVVDLHLQQFYDISSKMQSIQSLLSSTDQLYNKLTINVESLRASLLLQQSKLKSSLETYELKELQTSLLEQSRESLQFLVHFNQRFENIKEKDYQKLSKRDQNMLIKFSYKLQYIRKILSHHIIRKYLRGQDEIQTLESLELEFQTYISQQLIRLVQQKDYNMDKCNIRICYQYLNKDQTYFGIIQEHLVWNQLRVVDAQLLSNKTSIISSKNPEFLQSFFKNIFLLVSQLPKGFPKNRIVNLLKQFLNKKQFNFLYTYTLPIFPVAYRAFCQNIHFLNNESIQKQILKSHKWNIKTWSDVRSQDILRKSANEDIIKWLDLLFKKQHMFSGVISKTVRTALMMIGRYCLTIQKTKCLGSDYPEVLSTLVNYITKIPTLLQFYLKEIKIQETIIKQIISQISVKLSSSLSEFLSLNLQMVINNTMDNLCNASSFLGKVFSSLNDTVHVPAVIFKPLNSHLRNYPQLSAEAQGQIKKYVLKELEQKYQKLRHEVLQYSSINMTQEQKSTILKALEKDRMKLMENQ